MTYRLVFEMGAEKKKWIDLAEDEYPKTLLDDLDKAAQSGGTVFVRGHAPGIDDASPIYINPRAALWWTLEDRGGDGSGLDVA